MFARVTRCGSNILINAQLYGNEGRFVNHSCHPNCTFFECNWTNTTRLRIFADCDIPSSHSTTSPRTN
ncbi:SET domain [Phytophthora cactorum]|nr:SET domain [Phytophthora cactorum]